MMFAADPVMALLGLAFMPFASVVLARMGFLLRVTWLQVQRLMSILTLTMEENLQGIRVVRAFAARTFELAKFDKAANAALAYSYQRILLRIRAVSVMTLSFYGSHGPAALVRRRQGGGGDDDRRPADRIPRPT